MIPTYLRLRERAYSEKVIKNGFSRSGVYPIRPVVALKEFHKFQNKTPAEPIPILEEDVPSSSTETDFDSAGEGPSEKQPPRETWRSLHIRLLNAKVPPALMAYLKDLYFRKAAAEARTAIQEEEITRLQNKLDELVLKQSAKRKRVKPNPNKKIYTFISELDDDPDHPLVDKGKDLMEEGEDE